MISKDDFQKIYQKYPEIAKLITIPKEAIRALGGAKLAIMCVLKGVTLSNKTVKNLVRDVYVTANGIHIHPPLYPRKHCSNLEWCTTALTESLRTER